MLTIVIPDDITVQKRCSRIGHISTLAVPTASPHNGQRSTPTELAAGWERISRIPQADQATELQFREFELAGCKCIQRDHGVGGTRTARPKLDRVLDRFSRGDEVVEWKLDRPGRNTSYLLQMLDGFTGRGIKVRSLPDGIAPGPGSGVGGAMAQAMLAIMSAFAQLERDRPSERTQAGRAAAAAHGRKPGRREITAEGHKVKGAHEFTAQGLKPADIGRIVGVGRATIYRYLSMDIT